VVGVDHELEGPARLAACHLGEADRVVVAGLPGDEAGVPGAAALDQVEPLVFAQWAMAVGPGGDVEQLLDGGDIDLPELPLDLDVVHGARE